MEDRLEKFREIWSFDFEFEAPSGEIPIPICVVAREYRSKRLLKVWLHGEKSPPPYPISDDILFVAYYSSAELGCHLALGWPMPNTILDLFCEYRVLTNGKPTPGGNSLLGAMRSFGLNPIDEAVKEKMRELALRGGPWTNEERESLLNYCASDVFSLEQLLPKILPKINIPYALLRGRYMRAVAQMEHHGVPIDLETYSTLSSRWGDIQLALITSVDKEYGVFERKTFKMERWRQFLQTHNIPWPELPTGKLSMTDDTFSEMARRYAVITPMKELRATLSRMRLSKLSVGSDGRNRCLLSPFRAKTSRNQPSTAKFIFGPAKWFRGLIKPSPGYAIAYLDWSQQEFTCAQLFNDPDGSGQEPFDREAPRVNRLVSQITSMMNTKKGGPWNGKYLLISGVSHGASAPVIAMKHEAFDDSPSWKGSLKTGACFFDGISDIYSLDTWADDTLACEQSRNRNFCSRYDKSDNCRAVSLSDRDKDSISAASHANYLARPRDFAILNWKIVECGSALGTRWPLSRCQLNRDAVPAGPQINLCNQIKSDGTRSCTFESHPNVPHLQCTDTHTNGACYRWFDNLVK